MGGYAPPGDFNSVLSKVGSGGFSKMLVAEMLLHVEIKWYEILDIL